MAGSRPDPAWLRTSLIFPEGYTQFMMTTEELIDRVISLSVEEQISVIRFIEYLERRQVPAQRPFLQAAEEFIAEHPELLRRLAQ
jgi:hypothetical protein